MKGTLGGGGGVLVTNLDGFGLDGFGGEGEIRVPLPGAGRTVPAGDLFAVARRCARTGGAGTGRPGMAARAVGLTPGCGVTCAFASCSGLSFTISRATGLPLPKASERTAVVAMLRYAYWTLLMFVTFVIFVMLVTLRTLVMLTTRR
jgi:hypothetical protein